MKRLNLLFILLLLVTLSSCKKNEIQLTSINILGDSVLNHQIDVDLITDYEIELIYANGTSDIIKLSTDLINEYEDNLFSSSGYKDIVITYNNQSTTAHFLVYENELDKELLNIFKLAVDEDATTLTYQEWLETIKGDDGLGIKSLVINATGHLIITYTDDTTSDLGVVKGSDGDDNTEGFYLVNFYNVNGLIINTQLVEKASDAADFIPVFPNGYVFDNWDSSFSNVNENLDIYPVYHLEEYTVTLINEMASDIIIDEVEHGSNVVLPVLEKTGYTFTGWFTGETFNDIQVFNETNIVSDLTLYPRFELKTFKVTFETYTEDKETVNVLYNSVISLPPVPVNEDLNFQGWYTDETYTTEFTTGIMSDLDITLYAKWVDFDYNTYLDGSITYVRITNYHDEYDHINIPSEIDGYTVNKISHGAFRSATFSTVYVPNTIEFIEEDAFSNNVNLISIILPSSVKSIGNSAFENNIALESVKLPYNLTRIENSTFRNCESLVGITLNDNINYIGDYAFRDSGLLNIQLPQSLTNLNTGVLSGTSLSVIGVPEGVTRINPEALSNITTLTTIYLPSSLSIIDNNVFIGNPNLQNIFLQSNPNYIVEDQVLYSTGKISLIYYFAKKTTTAFTVPSSVLGVFMGAFDSNNYLETLTLPFGVSIIADYNFKDMSSLEAFSIYDDSRSQTIEAVDGVLYNYGRTTLHKYPSAKTDTSFTVPPEVNTIGTEAFTNTLYLETLVVSEGVVTVYYRAFENADSLTSITLPETLMFIYSDAFRYCDGLTTLNIPSGVVHIKEKAFADMSNLATITFTGTLEQTFGNYVFENSDNLTTINLSSGSKLGYYSLLKVRGVETITIPLDNPFHQVGENNIILNGDLTRVTNYLESTTVAHLVIPSSVTDIYCNFGYNPYLLSITFPDNVTYISGSAMAFLPNLESITILRTATQGVVNISTNILGSSEDVLIYVDKDSYSDYADIFNLQNYIDNLRTID